MTKDSTSHSECISSKKTVFSLCLASFIVLSGYSVIIPFLPIYANDFLAEISFFNIITIGIGFQIGLVSAANLMMKFFLAPAYGDLSDSTGRKPIIVAGMTLYTLLMIGYGLAVDFISLFILRLLSGVASSAVWPVGQALVIDNSKEEEVGRNIGFYTLSMLAGTTSGPIIGYIFYTLLYDAGWEVIMAYRLTFLGVAILGFIGTSFTLILVRDPTFNIAQTSSRVEFYMHSVKQLFQKSIHSPKFLLRTITRATDYQKNSLMTMYLVAIVNGFANALLLPILALFLEEYYRLNPGDISLLIGIVGVFSFVGAPLGGIISDNYGKKVTVWSSGMLAGIILMLFGFKTTIICLVLIFTGVRVLFMIMQIAFRALQGELVPSNVRGKEFGILDAAYNFGSVLGPVIGGFFYDVFRDDEFTISSNLVFTGPGIVFLLSGITVFLAMIIFFRNLYVE